MPLNRVVLRGVTAGLLLAACSAAMGVGDGPIPAASEPVLKAFPGAHVHTDQGRAVMFWGRPMTAARTADAAAHGWVDEWAGALAGGPVTLLETRAVDAYAGKFRVYGYQQMVDGVPVEYGIARVLVRRGAGPGGQDAVVLASGTLARIPDGGLPAVTIDGTTAVELIRAMPDYKALPSWSDASQIIWQGNGQWVEPVRCWTFIGESTDRVVRLRFRFYVDASTGEIVHVRNEVLNDVAGSVTGKGTPGTKPDTSGNPPVDLPMPEIKVNLSGGGSSHSARDGSYTIGFGGSGSVTVSAAVGTAGVGAGMWVDVNNDAGTEITASTTGDAASPVNLAFNGSPAELTTSQVNAFIGQTLTHDYIKDRAPEFEALDVSFPANVNIASTCNAYYDYESTNFYRSGGGCVNTGYSTVISHEYGHHIAQMAVGHQGGFGEGYGDTAGMLVWDDYIVGRDFFGPGGHIRNPRDAKRQYPCSGEAHFCGELIGGCWWWIRENLGTKYGSSAGLELARDLHVPWTIVTIGGSGPDWSNSADPTTAIEVLTLNDDDGVLENGTPDYDEICAAFDRHNVDCPPVQLIGFTYPDGRPASVTPDQAATIRVNIVAIAGTPKPGTGWVYYAADGGSFTGARMAEPKPNEYVATLPAAPCGTVISYYFTAESVEKGLRSDPIDAPASSFSALSATGILQVASDDFETDKGWTAGAPGDTATTGVWTRNDPQATDAQPGDDHSSSGIRCWVTDYRAGSSLGDYDVDGGKTTLVSPAFDLSSAAAATVSYWRWYSNDTGGEPGADSFLIDISNNDGSSWTRAETVGPSGDGTHGGWIYHEFRVAEFVAPTAKVRVRFIAQDLAGGSLIEAAVDDFGIAAAECTASCRPDCNKDGKLDIGDFICFQSEWNGRTAYGDFNGDGKYTVNDFVSFQGTFVRGCK